MTANFKLTLRSLSTSLKAKLPKLAEMMDQSRDDVLAFMDFPKAQTARAPLEALAAVIDSEAL